MTERPRRILLAVAAALLSCGADGAGDSLDIYFIDVQGGAATLVVTPARESVLIDSGWATPDDRDPRRIEHVVRQVAGLDHIDHLVTTHWHEDHYGGVGGLARRVRIDRFWDRGLPDPAAPLERVRLPQRARTRRPARGRLPRGVERERAALKPGDTLPLRGGVELAVLASGGKVVEAPSGPENPNCAGVPGPVRGPGENANCIALRLRLGKFDFLSCADLSPQVETALVCPSDRVGPVNLFLATHHGTALSNGVPFLRTVAPTVAVVNNGPRRGGDPTTMQRLRGIPSIQATYQLHANISAQESVNSGPGQVANADPAGGRFLRASVTPDGSDSACRSAATARPASSPRADRACRSDGADEAPRGSASGWSSPSCTRGADPARSLPGRRGSDDLERRPLLRLLRRALLRGLPLPLRGTTARSRRPPGGRPAEQGGPEPPRPVVVQQELPPVPLHHLGDEHRDHPAGVFLLHSGR